MWAKEAPLLCDSLRDATRNSCHKTAAVHSRVASKKKKTASCNCLRDAVTYEEITASQTSFSPAFFSPFWKDERPVSCCLLQRRAVTLVCQRAGVDGRAFYFGQPRHTEVSGANVARLRFECESCVHEWTSILAHRRASWDCRDARCHGLLECEDSYKATARRCFLVRWDLLQWRQALECQSVLSHFATAHT